MTRSRLGLVALFLAGCGSSGNALESGGPSASDTGSSAEAGAAADATSGNTAMTMLPSNDGSRPNGGATESPESAAGATADGSPGAASPLDGGGASGGTPATGGTSATGGTPALGDASASGGAGGDGGSGAVDGDGGTPRAPVSCDDFSCPDLGTCTVTRDGEECSRVCQFDEPYLVRTDEEARRLADLQCERIEGDLSLTPSSHDASQPLADFSTIREVTGSVHVGDVVWLQSLTGLERIDCALFVETFSATPIEFSALSYVGVGLALNQTYGIKTASFPSLKEVGFGGTETCGEGYVPMGLLFYINPDLIQIDMPALERVKERIYLSDCPELQAVCFPSLTEVDPSEGIATDITQEVLMDPSVCLPSELSDTLNRDAACPAALCQ